MTRDLRAPSPRLRWGRRSDPDVPILGDESSFNELDVQPEKRKPVRLRWGRSYKPGAEEVSEIVTLLFYPGGSSYLGLLGYIEIRTKGFQRFRFSQYSGSPRNPKNLKSILSRPLVGFYSC